MSFKNYFNNLKLYQKIELYLLVIMFYMAILYYNDTVFYNNSSKDIQNIKQNKIYNIDDFKNKIQKKDQIFFIKYLEKTIDSFSLFTRNIIVKNGNLTIEIDGKFTNMIKFITTIEQHIIIKNISFEKKDLKLVSTIRLKTKYFYNKNGIKSDFQIVPNPFIAIKDSNKTIKSKQLELNGIFNDTVLINHNSYKKGDIIDGYKITTINLDNIIIQKENKQKILRLYDE